MNLSGEVLSRVSSISFYMLCLAKGAPNFQKKNRDWSQEAFQLTTQILQLNPEFYTVWNYRRNILVNGIFLQKYAHVGLLYPVAELMRLIVNPKLFTIYSPMSCPGLRPR